MFNILIIDDEDYICKLIYKIAIRKNYNVNIAKNYQELKSILSQNNFFDIALIDYNFEKEKINDIINNIKQKSENCKIIIMSGSNEDEVDLSINYDKFIYKPELVETLNNIL
ncbi:MAG: response regulator [Exilispira sp.]